MRSVEYLNAYRICRLMGWSYDDYMNAPKEFIEAVIHWSNKDAEKA